jgi:hypothetical protein
MKNNTKIRLHLTKSLFESLAKQVLAESKKGDMSGGAYTEAVKAPKTHKENSPEVKKTDKMKTMGEMETRVAEDVDKEIADLRKQLEDMPDIADMSDEDKKKAGEINKKLRSLKAKKGIEEGPINENEAAAVQDLMQFLQDNAGFLAGMGGIVGAAKWIASKVAKDPEARKALDKATGAGSEDLGPFGGKSFGKK